MKKARKLLSALLSAALMCGLVCTTAFADQTVYFSGASAEDYYGAAEQTDGGWVSITGDSLEKVGTADGRWTGPSDLTYQMPVYRSTGPVTVALTGGLAIGESAVEETAEGTVNYVLIRSAGIHAVDEGNQVIQENVMYFQGNMAYEDENNVMTGSDVTIEDYLEGRAQLPEEIRAYICKGPTAVLSEPGRYMISVDDASGMADSVTELVVVIEEAAPADPEPTDPAEGTDPAAPAVTVEDIPAEGTAYASTQNITIDGTAVEFAAYALKDDNGNLTNYVKLRDIAVALNGSGAQFEVGFDGSIFLTTKTAYTGGSDMGTPFSGDREYKGGAQTVKVDDASVDMTAITLTDDAGGAYNYFKLRDLGAVLGFAVGYSNETGISITTTAE